MKAWFYETAKVTVKTAYKREIKEITIHNTESENYDKMQLLTSIASNHSKRLSEEDSCMWLSIGYHYIIFKDWTVVQTRCIDEIWYHNSKNNLTSLWVALEWNFNKIKPSSEQYEALRQLLDILKTQFTGAEVKPHRAWWSSCPGKNFDKEEIWEYFMNFETDYKPNLYWIYNVTRYYSPMTGQDHYYKGKTYEQDVTMNCWVSNINNDGCLYPANWIKLEQKDKLRVVACWWQFPLGTKFNIEWHWRVTCIDRGSWIKYNHLDLRAWIGSDWLNTIETSKRPAWDVRVLEVKLPNVK